MQQTAGQLSLQSSHVALPNIWMVRVGPKVFVERSKQHCNGLKVIDLYHNYFNFIWYWYHKKPGAVQRQCVSGPFHVASVLWKDLELISLPCFSSGRHSNLNLQFLIWLIVFNFKFLIPRPRDDDLLFLSVLSVWFVNMVCLHNLNCCWLVATP